MEGRYKKWISEIILITVLYKTTGKVKGIFVVLWSSSAKEYSKTVEDKNKTKTKLKN